ncbi:MAG TPA: hypothetical protein VK040_04465 [Balneolaceae bacterium]|nr:hypothetical protein [Balneolaceae bacterium]
MVKHRAFRILSYESNYDVDRITSAAIQPMAIAWAAVFPATCMGRMETSATLNKPYDLGREDAGYFKWFK